MEWMVDELVHREISGPRGSWIEFKTESHEAAKDITTELLESVVDEMVADLCAFCSSRAKIGTLTCPLCDDRSKAARAILYLF